MKNYTLITVVILTITLFWFCKKEKVEGPYLANGFRNGWADQNSVVIWSRLTKSKEMNLGGKSFIEISKKKHSQLSGCRDYEKIMKSQIPAGMNLEDMEGACPGTDGEIKIEIYPEKNKEEKTIYSWHKVEAINDYTIQWKFDDLLPDTKYFVRIQARKSSDYSVSDSCSGSFYTPPTKKIKKDISFCVVTCHDYIRRDDSTGGHKIYNSMATLTPDFYVHTGDVEYYDKPNPYALTKELMRFKWNRLFALPFQRSFYKNHTTYFIKDDHDALCNDAWAGQRYGTVTFEEGLNIFDKEQFPTNNKPYKTVRWGKDLQVWIVEGRNYRTPNDHPDGADKTIWGKEQKEWFFKTVKESDATFKVLISPTPILGPDRKNKFDNHSNKSFKHEGDEIRAFIDKQKNMFITNGDRHWQYVSHIEGTNLWEFSCGAGSDSHAGGWKQKNVKPQHKFLRVKGGFLQVKVINTNTLPTIKFIHRDVDGNVVNKKEFKVVG